jgi:hypothetical protein
MVHLAIVDRLCGETQAALAGLAEAHKLFREAGDLEGCAYALINSGHVLLALSRKNESSRCFDQARRIFEALGQIKRTQRAQGFSREARWLGGIELQTYLLN